MKPIRFTIEVEREDDGRWIAEVPEVPGAITYGATEAEAIGAVRALIYRTFAERIERGEDPLTGKKAKATKRRSALESFEWHLPA